MLLAMAPRMAAASTTCDRSLALGNQTAVALLDRAGEDLRGFAWHATAQLIEAHSQAADGSIPRPIQDDFANLPGGFAPTEQVLDQVDLADKAVLEELASAPHIDLVGKETLWKLDHTLARATPEQIQTLLRADSPNLRAFLWIWLTRTRRGGCILTHFDPAAIEAAVFERSLVVELGNELLMRPVSLYALAARMRLIAGKPGSLDHFLHQLAATELHATRGRLHPLVKASAHAILIRRGLLDQVDVGLRAPEPPVRAAVGLSLLESDPDLHEATVLNLAASDPVDLVTEALVEKVLRIRGVLKNPEAVGDEIPLLTGGLAETSDPRLLEAVARWFGHGDPLAPLPPPQARPEAASTEPSKPAQTPAIIDTSPGDPTTTDESARTDRSDDDADADADVDPPSDNEPDLNAPEDPPDEPSETPGPYLPSVTDEPD